MASFNSCVLQRKKLRALAPQAFTLITQLESGVARVRALLSPAFSHLESVPLTVEKSPVA